MQHSSKRQASFSRLAAGQLASRRSDIMLAATDTFCNHSRPDKTQIDQFRELFYSLIGETDETAKRLIASALSKHYYAPRQILLYLALENAAIAAPILAYSKALGQFDLLQIIDKTSNLHHRVIANRDDLGETVIGKLIELDDYLVTRRLEDNPSVDLPDTSTSKTSLEEVMEMPEPETIDRKQNIANALDEMNAILKRGKNSIRNNIATTDSTSASEDRLSEKNFAKPEQNKIKHAMDELISLANRGRRLGSVEDLLSDLPKEEKAVFAEQLLQATIKKNKHEQFKAIQSEFALDNESVQSIFDDQSGDTLSVCLKAANVETEIAVQIISHSILNVGLSPHNTQRISKIYPALNQDACMDTVKTWSGTSKPKPAEHVPATADDGVVRRNREETIRSAPTQLPSTGHRKLFGT